MPPFEVHFHLGSIAEGLVAIATIASVVVAYLLYRVSDEQRSIASQQTGLLAKQTELGAELDRGRLMRVEAGANYGGQMYLRYKNIGRSPVDIIGWVFWDFGEFARPNMEPKTPWFNSGQELVEPGSTCVCYTDIPDISGVVKVKLHGEAEVFRIAVRVYYNTLGMVREYQQAWVFRDNLNPDWGEDMYSGERHVGLGFERDRVSSIEEFRKLVGGIGVPGVW